MNQTVMRSKRPQSSKKDKKIPPETKLSKKEKVSLGDLEDIIQKGWETFLEVGNALKEIRDKRLYRDRYSTFQDYCQERWGYNHSHSYRLIKAAEVINILSPIGDIPMPKNEAQIRPLTQIEVTVVPKIWEEFCKQKNGAKPTANELSAYIKANYNTKNRKKRQSPFSESEVKLIELLNKAKLNLKTKNFSDLKQTMELLNCAYKQLLEEL